MFFGSTFRLLPIPVSDADDSEPSLLVCGQMRIVDDSSGAHNTDALVQALWQFGFVIEVRKDVSHFRSPQARLASDQQSYHTQPQTLTATAERAKNNLYFFAPDWEGVLYCETRVLQCKQFPSPTCTGESLSTRIQPFSGQGLGNCDAAVYESAETKDEADPIW